MGFINFFKEAGRGMAELGRSGGEALEVFTHALQEFNEEAERERAKKTFVDLREAIAYAIDNDTWSRVDNFLQYDWLLDTPILDGQEVIINTDFNKSEYPELRFGFIHKGKNYWVVVIHQRNYLMIIVKKIDSEEYPTIAAYYQWQKRALYSHRRIINQI